MPKKKPSSNKASESCHISMHAKNEEQKEMLRVISQNHITFVKGFPGTGKTHIAVGYALQALLRGDCEKLIFTRPVIEAGGEKLGFLPGNMYEKIDPYMIPIFEILSKLLPPSKIKTLMPNGNGNGNGNDSSSIRVLPLAYMRGCSFSNSMIIADEMQNSSPEQMRMLLTRLGEDSKMVLCGDVYQTDIQNINGLYDAFQILKEIDGIGFVSLTEKAIVRHPIIQAVEKRYSDRPTKNKKNNR